MWTTVTIIVVVGLVVSIGLGILRRGELDLLGSRLERSRARQSVILVESTGDLIVMAVGPADRREVRTMNISSQVVQDASRGAQQVSQPAVSHAGDQIAYFTTRDGIVELDVSEVGGASRTLIPASEFSQLARKEHLEELTICPWSRLSWSKEDRYLALYGCTDSESLVIVKELTSDNTLTLHLTKADRGHTRTLLWVNDAELAVVQPEEKYDTVWIVNVVSWEKERVFGP